MASTRRRLRRAGRPSLRARPLLARRVRGARRAARVRGGRRAARFDGERLLADAPHLRGADRLLARRAQPQWAPFVSSRSTPAKTATAARAPRQHRADVGAPAAARARPQPDQRRLRRAARPDQHEYFHTWNVKRLRRRSSSAYDYTGARTTPRLLWFFEGFTSYYDDLILRRCGLIDTPRYPKPAGARVSGVAERRAATGAERGEASFDAWVNHRSDENTPNATISYYAKGRWWRWRWICPAPRAARSTR